MVKPSERSRAGGQTFKIDDVVTVVRQPGTDQVNHLMDSMGFMGFIGDFKMLTEVLYIELQCLDGNGSGLIPIDCIELDGHPTCLQAKHEYDAKLEPAFQGHVDRRKVKEAIARQLDLPLATVEAVLAQWDKRK